MYRSFQMQDGLDMYLQNLDDESLHSFVEEVAQTNNGLFYIDSYYELSSYFLETLNTSLLLDISLASLAMKNFADAMKTYNLQYVLSTNDFNLFSGILQQSALNSDNSSYQAIVADIIEILEQFEGKTISEIYEILNS